MRQVQWQVRFAWLADVQFGPAKSTLRTIKRDEIGHASTADCLQWMTRKTNVEHIEPPRKNTFRCWSDTSFSCWPVKCIHPVQSYAVGSSWLRLHSPSNIISTYRIYWNLMALIYWYAHISVACITTIPFISTFTYIFYQNSEPAIMHYC